MTYQALVPTPGRKSINTGYSPLRVATLKSVFGDFSGLTDDCGKCRNLNIAKLLVTASVGPFSVTGIAPAVNSLKAIFAEIKAGHPDLYKLLGTEGMMCYRRVRGGSTPSNHAAGCAIDMKVGGICPDFNADMVPSGFVTMYGYFHAHGWYWGAGYNGRTDPMHFEWANETLINAHGCGRV